MAGPDQSPENPHRISFSSEDLGVSVDITFDYPLMETISEAERNLLTKLAAAEVVTLSLAIRARETQLSSTEWLRRLAGELSERHEAIYRWGDEINKMDMILELLDLDIDLPDRISDIPRGQTA